MRSRSLLPWVVLAASLVLTVIASWALRESSRGLDRERFVSAIQTTSDRIEARLSVYTALLQGGIGLFAAQNTVASADFYEYADRLDIQRQYPGIQGIGFTKRVRPEQQDSVLNALRQQGYADFRFWPDSSSVERHAIVYLGPLDTRNRAALGYNMYSEKTRRDAMSRARDTGAAAMTGRVTLVQEIAGPVQAGFLIYMPVYARGITPQTVEGRREALRGFIYAPFRTDDLFEGIFGSESQPRIAFRIYDGTTISDDYLLHDSRVGGIAPSESPSRRARHTLSTAGRTWTIVFETTDAFDAGSQISFVVFILLAGLAVSVVLFLITRAQVNADEAAHSSERRLRTVLESLPVGVFVADPAGRFSFVNTAARRIWGDDEGIIDRVATEFKGFLPDTNEPVAGEDWPLIRATRGERTGSMMTDIETFDGQRKSILSSAFPIRTSSGAVQMAVATIVDMTDQRKAEAALRSRERELNTLVDAIPQLAWMADPDGSIRWFNGRWYDYTGLSEKEAAGWQWVRLCHPDHVDRVMEGYRQAIEAGDLWEDTFPMRARDGEYRWFLALALPLRDDKGSILQWFGSNTDMTAQMQARETEERAIREQAAREAAEQREEQLRLQAAELERSNRELQEFAYVASHDLQEPLRKISAFADLLQVEYRESLDEQAAHYLDRMQHAALRMSRLIRDLLEFSRVATRANPFQFVDLNEALSGVVSDLEIRIQETGGRVEVGELPTVEADPMQMRQLLQNLIGNGLKFHREGVPPVVKVYGEKEEMPNPFGPGKRPVCRVSVEDNGIGFDPKYIDRIFLPFQRLHSRTQYEGTGIGLAICRRIVERHGGTLTATSTPGEGTTFTFVLPLTQPRHAALVTSA